MPKTPGSGRKDGSAGTGASPGANEVRRKSGASRFTTLPLSPEREPERGKGGKRSGAKGSRKPRKP